LKKINSMEIQSSVSQIAGSNYESATQFSFGDARNGLKYVLLRLSQLGLPIEDQEQLRELGRLAFNGSDVKHVADRITNTESTSPLAMAIADIVLRSGTEMTSKKMAMLGAVFGAYAAISSGGPNESVLGAIAGAVAVSTSELLQNVQQRDCWMNFVERD
jgi:hypothetical protein